VLGNEGNGVSEKILALTDQNLYIPIFGEAESLNVAVAAGILLYHFVG
jgi:TrmH family RNA methyltransferase